jgi:transposase
MREYIGCDSHQKYSAFVRVNESFQAGAAERVENDRATIRQYLRRLPAGSAVAVEASGGWYWLVDEIEAAGLIAKLTDPKEAKQRMRGRNKSDEIDARGLADLLYDERLPEVWIPPAELRDLRGLLRTRLSMRRVTTSLKNRISAAIRRYGLREDECSDLFAGTGRVHLSSYVGWLPLQTRFAAQEEWALLDETEKRIKRLEQRIADRIGKVGWVRMLKSLPGVGDILGATLWLPDWGREAVPLGRAPGQLRGADADGVLQRRQDAYGPHAKKRQPLSEMGSCGGRQRDHPAEEQIRLHPCGAVV